MVQATDFPWMTSYPPHINERTKAVVKEPVHRLFDRAAHVNPHGVCANFMGKKYSYHKMQKRINRFACSLHHMGLGKGDRIGICLPNVPDFIVSYYGAMKAGCTVVNFNPLLTAEELTIQAQDAKVAMIITIDVAEIFHKVQVCAEASGVGHIVVSKLSNCLPPIKKALFKIFKSKECAKITETHSIYLFKNFINHNTAFEPPFIHADKDIALLQYTGGTTGEPKAAMLTHANISSNTQQVTAWLGSQNKDEKFLAVLPFFHVFSMTAVMNLAISTASELVLLPRFDLKQTLKTITKEKITMFSGVPTIFNAINNVENIHQYDLSSIRYCVSGGAALPEQVRDDFVKLTGAVLVEGYGCTEASPVITCNPPHTGGKAGSIGLPIPATEVEIRNPENLSEVMPIGERGEICARGPQVMVGYHNRPEDDKDIFIESSDGGAPFLRTGDVGYMDNDGYVFLTDRIKEIIIASGFNVYPRIIEEAFYKHPLVDEVIVVGIPHPYKGEAPKAFLKLKQIESTGELVEGSRAKQHRNLNITEEELLAFACEHLNPIEKPVEVEFRDELPKTLIGKLSKKELKEEVAQSYRNKETS